MRHAFHFGLLVKQIVSWNNGNRIEKIILNQLWKKLGIIKIQIINNNEEWQPNIFKARLILMTLCG